MAVVVGGSLSTFKRDTFKVKICQKSYLLVLAQKPIDTVSDQLLNNTDFFKAIQESRNSL